MCTYETEIVELAGSGKGQKDWFDVTSASVYYDHPFRAFAEHTLNIDFLNRAGGPSARLAVELDPRGARALAHAILEVLETVESKTVAS